MTPNRAEVQAAAERVLADYSLRLPDPGPYPLDGPHRFPDDVQAVCNAYLAQDPSYADLTAKLAAAEAQLAEEKREHLATQELHERSMRMIEEAIGPTRDLFDGWRAQVSAKAIASIVSQLAKSLDQLAAFSDPTPLTPEVVMELLPATWCRNDSQSGEYTSKIGSVEWAAFDGDLVTLKVCGREVALEEIGTVGNFRHLLAALRIGGAA